MIYRWRDMIYGWCRMIYFRFAQIWYNIRSFIREAYIIARSAISYRRYITRSDRNGYNCKKHCVSSAFCMVDVKELESLTTRTSSECSTSWAKHPYSTGHIITRPVKFVNTDFSKKSFLLSIAVWSLIAVIEFESVERRIVLGKLGKLFGFSAVCSRFDAGVCDAGERLQPRLPQPPAYL